MPIEFVSVYPQNMKLRGLKPLPAGRSDGHDVFLDGVRQINVVEADAVRGYIDVLTELSPFGGSHRLWGRVEIVFNPNSNQA